MGQIVYDEPKFWRPVVEGMYYQLQGIGQIAQVILYPGGILDNGSDITAYTQFNFYDAPINASAGPQQTAPSGRIISGYVLLGQVVAETGIRGNLLIGCKFLKNVVAPDVSVTITVGRLYGPQGGGEFGTSSQKTFGGGAGVAVPQFPL